MMICTCPPKNSWGKSRLLEKAKKGTNPIRLNCYHWTKRPSLRGCHCSARQEKDWNMLLSNWILEKGNTIQKVSGLQNADFANLVSLELRANHLETTSGFELPNLRKLYLGQNLIKRLEGLEKLERLTTLHLRDNHLENLEGLCSEMKSLQYLNVRGNAIAEADAIRSLRLLTNSLKVLIIAENPIVETLIYRPSVLVLLPHLDRIDKEIITLKERTDARRTLRELKEEEGPPA